MMTKSAMPLEVIKKIILKSYLINNIDSILITLSIKKHRCNTKVSIWFLS